MKKQKKMKSENTTLRGSEDASHSASLGGGKNRSLENSATGSRRVSLSAFILRLNSHYRYCMLRREKGLFGSIMQSHCRETHVQTDPKTYLSTFQINRQHGSSASEGGRLTTVQKPPQGASAAPASLPAQPTTAIRNAILSCVSGWLTSPKSQRKNVA